MIPDFRDTTGQPTVLIATADNGMRNNLSELLETFSIRARWARGVEEANNLLAREEISVCFCGFWLADGTYRELVKRIKREAAEIPLVIVSAPACPNEYRDYLAAMNIGAFDFLCHPYRRIDLDRILRVSLVAHFRSQRRVGLSEGGCLDARQVESTPVASQ
jgi:DNA-binding NtrC family response regulator